ncbi:MAG: hypothetical protein R2932_51245 [Caldilineaceae bacterium]
MTGQLPTTQPYLIEVNTVGAAADYTLRVALAPTANSGAERVPINADGSVVARNGRVGGGRHAKLRADRQPWPNYDRADSWF